MVDIQWIHLLMPSGETTVASGNQIDFFPSVSFFFKNQRIFTILSLLCVCPQKEPNRENLYYS